MNYTQKYDYLYDYLNLWSAVSLSYLGIGLTLCLKSVKQEYFYPADKDFAISHFFIFLAVFWVFAFIIYFLNSFILSIKYEKKLQNTDLNMVSAFASISVLYMTGFILDFLSIGYVIYLFVIFIMTSFGFIFVNIENFMKITGQALAFMTLALLSMGLFLRLGNI